MIESSLVALLFVIALAVRFTPDPEAGLIRPDDPAVVNDVTGMNPIHVERVVVPKSVEEIQRLIRTEQGPFSVGGGHFSMGGQTASEGTIHLDMRGMDHVIGIDRAKQQVTVESGITWHKLQEAIDPYGLSVKIMQSYANFSVGGSLSVNVHGRYIGLGPLVGSVESIKVVLSDGTLVEVSRDKFPELFYGCIGGYGGLGIIVAATLNLDHNVKVKREVVTVAAADYPEFFKAQIRDNHDVIFQNGDLLPDQFQDVYSVAWKKTNDPVTEPRPFSSTGIKPTFIESAIEFLIADVPYGIKLRRYLEPLRYRDNVVEWRNFEASYDVSDLAPISTPDWSYVLQEYFVPIGHFEDFVGAMRDIFRRNYVDMANVSIRHAIPDNETIMSWARSEVFTFVLYYRQNTDTDSRRAVGNWTRELVEAAVDDGGSYYLPYQPQALRAQFFRAYPRAPEFFALKKKVDPDYKFRNKLWDAYYQPTADRKLFEETAPHKEYFHPEDRTYLTVPEWESVFLSQELAASVGAKSESHFPFFEAVYNFWKTYVHVLKVTTTHYRPNWGYHLLNCVSGIRISIEYLLKGLYEGSVGRLTTWLGDADNPPKPGTADAFIYDTFADYAVYIHEKPWYLYPFYARFQDLWRLPLGGDSFIRRYERKLSFSTELLVKAALGKLFALGARSIHGAEEPRITAAVNASDKELQDFFSSGNIVAKIDNNLSLVSLPRFEAFTDVVRTLVRTPEAAGVSFREIAGNKRIVCTVIAPIDKTIQFKDNSAAVIIETPLLNEVAQKRVTFSVGVPDLLRVLRELDQDNILLEHVFDY